MTRGAGDGPVRAEAAVEEERVAQRHRGRVIAQRVGGIGRERRQPVNAEGGDQPPFGLGPPVFRPCPVARTATPDSPAPRATPRPRARPDQAGQYSGSPSGKRQQDRRRHKTVRRTRYFNSNTNVTESLCPPELISSVLTHSPAILNRTPSSR